MVTFNHTDVEGLRAYLAAEEGGTLPPQLKSAAPQMLRGVLSRIEAELSGNAEGEFTEAEAEELAVLGDACHQYAILADDSTAMMEMGNGLHGLAQSVRARLS
jgi:hypothetical protein